MESFLSVWDSNQGISFDEAASEHINESCIDTHKNDPLPSTNYVLGEINNETVHN